MKRMRYDQATKDAIYKAVDEARVTGTWKDAHKEAQNAGYKGSLGGLMQLVLDRKQSKKTASTTARGKPTKKAEKPTADRAATPIVIASLEPEETDPDLIVTAVNLDSERSPFLFESIPEAIRGDLADVIRAKIEKVFKHAIKDENLGLAMALYMEIYESQKSLDAKIEALKSL